MKVNRLCFILPADFNDIAPSDYPKAGKVVKTEANRHPHRSCGSHVLGFVGDALRRLYESRWFHFCHHGKPRRHQSSVFHDLEGVQMSEKVGGENPRIFSYAELYIGSNGFHEDEILGSGGFGKVYRAVLPSDGTVVAVKCLAEKGERFEKTFAAELVAVAHLRHRNLVRLRGWCVHEDQLLLVYDYMPNRSLDRVLFRRPENMATPPLNWDRRRKIVGGLAAALFYLHEQLETQIIHRDVKTSNVMLDSQYNARLGDFGLARWLEHELEHQIKTPATKRHQFRLADTTRIGGTIGYLPPESFQKRSVTTAKSDVFSFGIVVLEVVSGRRAVDLTFPDEQIILLDWIRRLSDEQRLLHAGDSRLADGSYRLADVEQFLHIGLLCTLHNPFLRPNMKWVVEVLSGNISGKLPALPSFESHPLYITLSSSSNTSGSKSTASSRSSTPTPPATAASIDITVSFASSNYLTATEETMYETAEFGIKGSSLSSNSSRRPTNFFMIETPREIPFKELIAATDNFAESRRVAELDFGTAYHGFLDNRQHILVKRLGMTKCPALRTRFSSELQNLARLRHRNLVQLRGWCTEQGEMLVVYDYSANRLLSHLLFDKIRGSSVLQWQHRYNIVKSLASAIHYLHEEWDEQVIHRNITSSAIILDPNMNPRLSNFALAEFLTRNDHGHHASTNKNRSVCGIFGYMSPEYMEYGEATPMADVYSFGVVVLEVISGHMAGDFRRPEVLLVKRVHDFETQKRPLKELVDIRLNGEYNNEEVLRLTKLGVACTQSDPKLRPTMRQIVSILDGNDKSLMMVEGQRKEGREEWKQRYACSLSLVRRIHALGLH
ncbi:Receptor like protein kinase S.2 [Hibiscus syriacus]|uniref:Receptor like protein kinase S.2 n=1 Tax=Hibiscus syriacus TaxID=106335 RepID=A0A6A2X0K8_HIBSY|nr:receptor like protein kinase S.2-like [Hibiscus syriacus]KAE8668092.1 Receptor like protein kinase S.2 [Hibiscus syriacus]